MDGAANGYADPRTLFGTTVPNVWSVAPRRSLFGDVVLVAFLVAQVLDGAFTYMGVMTFGLSVEANPVIASPRGVVAVDALVEARRAES